mmetsp:Transcript_6161/g.17350  ORF Transcript_6161/g.17350 Transcript_6161/m.17350 type:complete len:245 (+) Transcript_6161:65-799(+)
MAVGAPMPLPPTWTKLDAARPPAGRQEAAGTESATCTSIEPQLQVCTDPASRDLVSHKPRRPVPLLQRATEAKSTGSLRSTRTLRLPASTGDLHFLWQPEDASSTKTEVGHGSTFLGKRTVRMRACPGNACSVARSWAGMSQDCTFSSTAPRPPALGETARVPDSGEPSPVSMPRARGMTPIALRECDPNATSGEAWCYEGARGNRAFPVLRGGESPGHWHRIQKRSGRLSTDYISRMRVIQTL